MSSTGNDKFSKTRRLIFHIADPNAVEKGYKQDTSICWVPQSLCWSCGCWLKAFYSFICNRCDVAYMVFFRMLPPTLFLCHSLLAIAFHPNNGLHFPATCSYMYSCKQLKNDGALKSETLTPALCNTTTHKHLEKNERKSSQNKKKTKTTTKNIVATNQ